jgi:hypothetical protein
VSAAPPLEIQTWPIEKNDAAVDRMCSSIREFGFKVPVLVERAAGTKKTGGWA